MALETFSAHRIRLPDGATGEIRTTCPECSGRRRKANDRCLAVNVVEGCWICHHCGWTGSLKADKTKEEIKRYFIPKHTHVDLPEHLVEYLLGRYITRETMASAKLSAGWLDKETLAIKFPYFKGGIVVNAKYRTVDKRFRQEKNAEQCLYRFDEVSAGGENLVICEGELDALSVTQSGVGFATSVPNGAPAPGAKTYQKEFSYLEGAEQVIAAFSKVTLAVDNDAPGKVLEQELARRIGPEKCYRVQYPRDCKDMNDVLAKHGAVKVREIISDAKPYPIDGIYTAKDIEDLVVHLYECGQQRGVPTGWVHLDKYYTVKTGQLTVVTGIPGSGKSVWLDALMVNLTLAHDWRFAIFSPENWPLQRHMQSIIEKLKQKPFDRDGFRVQKISKAELVAAIESIGDRFYFIMPEESLMTVDSILERARVCIFRYGVKGLVIDPWNEIEHQYGNLTETQYISETLSRIRRFARRLDVHVWVVAHPQKLTKDKDSGKYNPPTMYEISGGAHWRNKADVGICVHRPDFNKDMTDIYVQKVRFREVGQIGGVKFSYSRDVGTYSDIYDLGQGGRNVNDVSDDGVPF